MNITQLYAALRTAIGRSTSLDAELPGYCQEAINELETAALFKWMEKSVTLTVNPGLNGNVVPLPSNRVAAIQFIRSGFPQGTNGAIVYGPPLAGVSPFDFLSVDEGTAPGGFYINGVSDLILDGIPPTPLALHMVYYEYTEWPDDGAETPAILARHYAGTKALALAAAAKNLRDERLAAVWAATAEGAKQAMWMADAIDGRIGMVYRRGMQQREGVA